MAIRETRTAPASIDRIQQHRKPRKPAPPSREALSVVRGVVERSASIADAIVAVRAVETAWANVSVATREAVGLLLAILELSNTVDEALATFAMLNGDGKLLKPLNEIRSFVQNEFPDARKRIVPGDEVSSAYLDIFIPTDDYPAFWEAHVRLRDWVVEHLAGLSRSIQIVPRPARPDHV